ncbi:PEGA domain-containing protein [Nibribacter ruber]|uniref:PEGA domain-containing protein n=1 Tax=Nibribacter ruber TaxID=2698458 RepID=A0A6P1P1U5_9BACT|nr:carboxypeptidase-like regulatory domain-containing protein [Nibribacter ruber]QHL88273.1 PEGA domain-containing protein [Nibribacter ruber]
MFPFSRLGVACLLWVSVLVGLPGKSLAQGTGTVIGSTVDTEANQPLGFATVFIAQTTYGTMAAENGSFKLPNLPAGKHELVVSYLGYETVTYAFTLQPGQELKIKVGLTPKPNALQEVVITKDPHWRENYAVFVKHFLGNSVLAKKARILNSEALYFEYIPATNVLTAEASEALIIENKELGYKLHFLLKEFRADFKNQKIFHAGYPRFEPMVAKNEGQRKRWEKARLAAYNGSVMHFVRALHTKTLRQEGFSVRRLQRLPNPDRLPEAQIQAGLKRWRPKGRIAIVQSSSNAQTQDSLNYWFQMSRVDKIMEVVHNDLVPYENMVQREAGSNLLLLHFQDFLQVVYTGEKEEPEYLESRPFMPNRKPSFQTSVLSLLEPFTYLEPKGMILNPYSFLVEGYWGWEKLAEMLPLDYAPVSE